MSSDIDIEEHDVLEHPSIKKIFPDLSWLKTEFYSLDDEESTVFKNIRIEATSESKCFEEFGQRNDPVQDSEDVIVLDDVQCPEVEEINELSLETDIRTRNVDMEPIIVEDEECEDAFETDDPIIHEILDSECSDDIDDKQDSLLTKNTIVLGSNIPNKMIIGSNVPQKVVGYNNPEYSGSNVTKTSLVSEFGIERDPFSAKVILKDWGYILKKHPFYCDECLILLPTQSASNAHNASEHSLLVPIEEVEVVTHDSQIGDLGLIIQKCPICSYIFKTPRNYLAHIESKHDTIKLEPIHEVFHGNCMMCSDKHYKTVNTYCKHITNCHSKVYHRICSDIDPRSTTNVDDTILSSPNKARKSTAKLDRINIARKSTTKPGEGYKNVALKSTAKHSKNIALKSTSKPIQPRRIAVKSTSKSESKTSYSRQSNEHIENPKLNYICPICGTYYRHIWQYVTHCNTEHQAVYLSPKRLRFTGSCECGFKTTAIKHLNTHISKKHKKLFKKIATTLQEYYCLECDITFATLNSYNIHKIKHSHKVKEENRCDRKSHQMEDFLQFKDTETISEPKDVGDEQKVLELTENNFLYYCHECKSYDPAKHADYHRTSVCLQNKSFRICRFCGLRFSHESFADHILGHQNNSFDLNSIQFIDIHTGEVMKPKIPDWNKFAGDSTVKHSGEKRKRESLNEKTVYCEECQENYYELAYKIHLQYHETTNTNYIDAEIMQKNLRLELSYDGPSTHTLYKCAVCDAIVEKEHLLDHAYSKDVCKNQDKFSCSSCELAFITRESLDDHELHHLPDTKTRIILFNKPKHFSLNVRLIQQSRISNSSDRNSKSKSTAIFYKCLRCEAGIQHLLNIKTHNCSLSKTYMKCERCGLKYRPTALNRHILLHKKWDKFYIAPFKNGNLVWQGKTKLLRLYKCKKCKICTHKKLPAHTCRPENSRACSSCGLQFSQKSFKQHMELHVKAPNLARNNLLIIQYTPDLTSFDYEPTSHETEKSISDESSNAKPVTHKQKEPMEDNPMSRFLYKCSCGLLFLKWNQLRDHVKKCSDDFKPSQCKCGLKFHTLSLRDHLNVHLNCSSIKNYLVARVNVGKAAIANARKNWLWYCTVCRTYYNDIKNLNCHFKGNEPGPSERCSICRITISSSSFEDHMELHNEDNEFSHKQLHKLSLRMIATDALKTPVTKRTPTLYQCKKCDVHFITPQQLQSHLVQLRHDIDTRIQCTICHYFFATNFLRAHKITHHYKKRYKRDDFVIQTIEIADEEDIDSNKLEINESRTNRGQPTEPKHHDFAKTPENIKKAVYKSIGMEPLEALKVLHKCGICHLYFMVKNTILSHLTRHSKTSKRRQSSHTCSICGLEFSSRSLRRHIFVHHKTFNLQVQDFEIRVYTSPETFTITRIKSNKKQSKKRKILSDRVERAKKIKYVPSPPKPEAVAALQPTASNVAHFENASQIFKCAECNVFFTNYGMCYDHTLNHKPLDNTEYISCKLCDFQLLCECLGVHMKGHREGTFNIGELLVKEFQPGEGVPSIKTYLARDSLEANVISTTTNCS
ncbi:unnamed protein product [Pieris macdunnoughi]|uniref:C2H2-type domain-containing protein n=1 Tax=Pieris macdunnoughi TaxID=345717 RepID=A0A821VRU0_9NEOP|nr:unnamed protein product [Pieris macdunnoughi]